MVGGKDRLVLVFVALPLATGLLKHTRGAEKDTETPNAAGAISLLGTGATVDGRGDRGDTRCACDYTLGGRKRLHRKKDCMCQRSAPGADAGAPEPLYEQMQIPAEEGGYDEYRRSSRAAAYSAPGQGRTAVTDKRWLPPGHRKPHYDGPLGVTGPVRRLPDPPPQAPQAQATLSPQAGRLPDPPPQAPQAQATLSPQAGRLPDPPPQAPQAQATLSPQARLPPQPFMVSGPQAPAVVDAQGRALAGLPRPDADGPASSANQVNLVPFAEAMAKKEAAKVPAPLLHPERKRKVEKVGTRPQIAFGQPSIDEYTSEIRIPIDSTALAHGEQYQLGKPVQYGHQMWVPLNKVGSAGAPPDADARMQSRSVDGGPEPGATGPDELPEQPPRGRRPPVGPEDEELDDLRVREMSVHAPRSLPLPIRASPARPLAPPPPQGRYRRSFDARPAYRPWPPAYSSYWPAASQQPPYPHEEPPYWSNPPHAQSRAYPW